VVSSFSFFARVRRTGVAGLRVDLQHANAMAGVLVDLVEMNCFAGG
jgi:hypothetical protein